MLIFGLSFRNDAHLIASLLDYAREHRKENPKRKIFITCIEDETASLQAKESFKPSKLLPAIAKEKLEGYYANVLKDRCLEWEIDALQEMIEDLPIKKNKEQSGIFWIKNPISEGGESHRQK
jgi:hypothetical protein